MSKGDAIRGELESLRNTDGLLIVEDIHDWANEHRDSAIAESLEWDDTVAGRQWRLQQLRQIIRVHLVTDDRVRTEISISVDRSQPKGGYRRVADVVEAPDLFQLAVRH
jgi:hypothetical protein